jgi:hypothetical protein
MFGATAVQRHTRAEVDILCPQKCAFHFPPCDRTPNTDFCNADATSRLWNEMKNIKQTARHAVQIYQTLEVHVGQSTRHCQC